MTKVVDIPKEMTRVNWGVVGSVVVGIAMFGGLMYAVGRLPSNPVTDPIKTAAGIARG